MKRRFGTEVLESALVHYLREQPRTIRELRTWIVTQEFSAGAPSLERVLQKLRKSERVQLLGRLWAGMNVRLCAQCCGRGWHSGVRNSLICSACVGTGWVSSSKAEAVIHANKSQ